ncbi:MAG: hypothetical protein Q4E22_05910 [Coriobacteriia bacterium]|nr:hypothetical protein [Coriobacteriia bacterium]
MSFMALAFALVLGVLPMMAQTALASENGGALRLMKKTFLMRNLESFSETLLIQMMTGSFLRVN